MSRKRVRIGGFLAGAMVAVVVLSAVALGELKRAMVAERTEIFVPTGSDYQDLLTILDSAKVERTVAFELIAELKKLPETLKPGRYVLPAGASANGVVNMLRSGAQTPVNLTFNNIHMLDQLAARLAQQIEADSAELMQHLSSPEVAADYGLRSEQMIGLFIPNTYQVWWNISPKSLTDRMKREYDNFWTDERTAKLERLKLEPMEVITLASIVYEESKIPSEMRKIAGVYVNRLRRGIALQACPTAKYAVGDFSLTRILHKHTQVESPYNTYLHRGLPPGPICMPSIVAIDAVLDYEQHSYLYFCAKEDFSGYHYFSRTLREHNNYANRYTKALRRQRR